MANKSHDEDRITNLITREIENTFKKINEGIEQFNYYYQRHMDLNDQILDKNLESQKEKMETELKKEIKKLQKNRELIKNWQLNDTIEVLVSPNKLQEHRKFVEEAMEKYKEVEKSSKMKSFSNQSIMLATLEANKHLSPEEVKVINFMDECIEEINSQIESLDAEYERVSNKKIKKNNSSSIESEKQEIENFLNNNKFHLERFEKIINFVHHKQIDPELVWKIKDDITFYLESNQEPDFVDDETLYDEIYQQGESNFTYNPKGSETNNEEEGDTISEIPEEHDSPHSNDGGITIDSKTASKHRQKSDSPTPITPVKKVVDSEITPVKNKPATPDLTSPAIVKSLKPASTPSRVSGEVAWSSAAGVAAAVSGGNDSSSESVDKNTPKTTPWTISSNSPVSQKDGSSSVLNGSKTFEKDNNDHIVKDSQQIMSDNQYNPYRNVIQASGLHETEVKLFSDERLIKIPPGIQHLIMSFSSSRGIINGREDSKILYNSNLPDPLSTSIRKPFIPKSVQNSFYQYNRILPDMSFIKPPLHLLNYQHFWNKIRANDGYTSFVNEIKSLIEQENQQGQNTAVNYTFINELQLVLFFGFYYGVTPLENLIAETLLFGLGWRPYSIKGGLSNDNPNPINPDKYYYWFRDTITREVKEQAEFSDYQVFDLSSWEIHLKRNFKLDWNLVVSQTSSVIA